MIKEAVGIGETIEEARENALLSLGTDITTDIDFEVLDTPKKKAFGLFGGNPAKVRVFTEIPDEKPARAAKPEPKKAESAPKPAPKPVQKPAPKAAAPVAAASKPEAPAQQTAAPAVPKAASAVSADIVFVPADQLDPNTPIGRAAAYLQKVLVAMDVKDVSLKVGEIEGGHQIDLIGTDLGVIIGRRGETLDALQYLVSLAANNGENYTRVVLNTGNYREKREQTLESLAIRVSSQVLRTGRSRSLEPMNPYERRVIHTAVQKIEGVSSNSIGDGANRRVVISSVNGGYRGGNKGGYSNNRQGGGYRNDNRRGGTGSRGGYNNNNRRPGPNPSAPANANRTPKSDVTDRPLYGKIDTNK